MNFVESKKHTILGVEFNQRSQLPVKSPSDITAINIFNDTTSCREVKRYEHHSSKRFEQPLEYYGISVFDSDDKCLSQDNN